MIDFVIFITFITIGWIFRSRISQSQQALLKKLAYYVLLMFVIISLWIYGLPQQSWQLILLGGILQLIPALIGSVIGSQEYGRAFLIFSTFGGGNRGALALSLLSPALLPVFVLIDLGNFLALILFYPTLVKWGLSEKLVRRVSKPSFIPLLTSIAILLVGIFLHTLSYGLENGITRNLHQSLKWLLIVLTSLQIGIYLTFNTRCFIWTLKNLIQVRLIALILPLLIALSFISEAHEVVSVLFLFAILPVSSLVVSILPNNITQAFQQQLACAVTASTFIFLIVLLIVAGGKFRV